MITDVIALDDFCFAKDSKIYTCRVRFQLNEFGSVYDGVDVSKVFIGTEEEWIPLPREFDYSFEDDVIRTVEHDCRFVPADCSFEYFDSNLVRSTVSVDWER